MTFPNGFIKEEKLPMLEEYHRTTDLLDLSNDIKKFQENISRIKESCIVGLVGKLGSGKTTFINQFKQSVSDSDKHFFQFEAWKYPGRKDLWENFVLELAEQLGQKNKSKYIKKIDGTQHEDKKALVSITWAWIRDMIPGGELIKDIISGGDAVEKGIQYFLQTSPATRVFQLQALLTELLASIDSDTIYIAIEDVDRAGDEGLFFLETLSYYVKEIIKEKTIIVISLIGEENFSIKEKELSFQKCLDLKFNHEIKNPSFENFVNELFVDDIVQDNMRKGQIRSFLEGLFIEYDHTTMRMIKSALRQSNIHYQRLVEEQKTGIDRRICIMLEFAKRFIIKENKSYFDNWKQTGILDYYSTIFGALLNCVAYDNHRFKRQPPNSIYERDPVNKKMKLIERKWDIHSVRIKDKTYLEMANELKDDPIRFFTEVPNEGYFGLSYKYFE